MANPKIVSTKRREWDGGSLTLIRVEAQSDPPRVLDITVRFVDDENFRMLEDTADRVAATGQKRPEVNVSLEAALHGARQQVAQTGEVQAIPCHWSMVVEAGVLGEEIYEAYMNAIRALQGATEGHLVFDGLEEM